ncbi:MAG: serine/threonine-protein phosphatase, partial [Porticoccaceae bacterium]|nr:serine/threonine-protein phosphatase [Porticoccaceae bacterium]
MVSYAADTHRGNVRKLNEDCYEADPELSLWLVADGVGGHASGDVASKLTRATIRSVYLESGDLVSAIESAHSEVLNAIARKEGGSNMGSTVIAA